ncbi:MAG: RagB/SusD family nutrient uptake outer membrane protein [Muribaculaceae bacterium]|nr:RagB/SusD family nutrient uptake outer membrane protein [Muribaculaceae bacterium]
MKKSIILGLIACGAALTGCNDFLDDNRYPTDKQTDTPAYWTSEVNVQSQINQLYTNFTGYGSGGSWVNNYWYKSLSDDQCSEIYSGANVSLALWAYRQVPTANSVWDASYVQIRRCNFIINNSNLANFEDNADKIGQARLIRAMQYYDLVRNLGDVPLVTEVLAPESPELYGERTPRNTVMDFVLEDLDFAIANIKTQKSMFEFNVDMANAMKSEICLYEAAYARYHQKDETRAKKYYGEVVKACNAIMAQGYGICKNYLDIYTSFMDADANLGIPSIKNNPEIIFARGYKTGTLGHSTASYLSTETKILGMTKDAFDSYLFKDGKPKALTSYDTSDLPEITYVDSEPDKDGNVTRTYTFDISKALEGRDNRLAQTIDPKLAFGTKVTFQRPNSNFLQSTTGYTIKKYVQANAPYQQTYTNGSNQECAPIYWLSYTYCDYLEARAELGELTDADITTCMKPLWERAEIETSNLNKAYLEGMNDPANNMGVSSLLWEIRRLRRSELMFDCNHRYWDLVRWHKLDLLDTTKPENINIVLGANVSEAPEAVMNNVFTNNGYINASQTANTTESRVFSDREYLQPLGTTIISLYADKGLTLPQNPGW